MAIVTFKGTPVNTSGNLPAIGKQAPMFALAGDDLGTYNLADARGKWVVLNIFPSLDTPVCALSVRRFNTEAVRHPNMLVLCISADLPFAQGRFCGADGLKNIKTLSVFRAPSFGRDYGLTIIDSPLAGLLARAVVLIDPAGVVKYTELVPEIAQEPDYTAVLKALK